MDRDAIAARTAATLERRHLRVDGRHVDLRRHPAAIAFGIEDRDRPHAALAGHHPAPRLLARDAERRDEADAADDDSPPLTSASRMRHAARGRERRRVRARSHLAPLAPLPRCRDGQRQELKRERDHGKAEARGPPPRTDVARAESGKRRDIGGHDAIRVARDRAHSAMRTPGLPSPARDVREKLLTRAARRRGPRPPHASQRVRVAAGHDRQPGSPRPRGTQLRGNLFAQLVVRRQHRPVADLECRDLVEQTQIGIKRQLPAIEVQEMIERKEDAGLAQPRRDLEDIAGERLDVPMQRLGHPVHADVHLDAAIRDASRSPPRRR